MHYILIPFAWLLRMLYKVFNNYGVALILFSLITKLILLPFTAKSKKSTMKTARLGPKLKELEAKYKDDRLKYQQEMSALYKKEGVRPAGGCLWSLLPLVLLMILYYVIRQPMTYLMQLSADEISQITALFENMGYDMGSGNSAYSEITIAQYIFENLDVIKTIIPDIADRAIDFSFLGVQLSQIPSWRWIFGGSYSLAGFGLFFIPIISAGSQLGSMLVSQHFNNAVATDDKGEVEKGAGSANRSMKMMMWIMPIFSLWIGYSMPASMGIYWIAQAVFNTTIDSFLTVHYKKVYDAEDEIKREKAAEEARLEAEKEARRQERLANNSSTINPNTSRRKIKNQQKAMEPTTTVKGKLSEKEREELRKEREQEREAKEQARQPGIPAGNRPYSRGRAYDASRFSTKESVAAEVGSDSEAESE